MPAARGPLALSGRRTGSVSAAETMLDLRHDSGVGIEELLLDLVPTAEVVDREHLRANREAELADDAAVHWPVAGLREQALRRRCVEKLRERLRGGAVLAVLQDC